MNKYYELAKQELLTSDNCRCQLFFEKHQYYTELGYCHILNDRFTEAKEAFNRVIEQDIRAHWANFMIELIEGQIHYYPSYFELRNFLEIDLNLLIQHYKGNYVEKLVNYSDFLSNINPEVCKFIGRVFYYNNYPEYALHFFNQAKTKFYRDPELHYLFAQMYLNLNRIDDAIKYAKICLEVLPNYYPAEVMLKKLLQK